MLARSFPFKNALRIVKRNRMAEDAITPWGNKVIETNIINTIVSRVRFKIIALGNFSLEVRQKKGKYLFRKSKGLFHQKLKTGDTGINDHQLLTHPIVRKLFVEKIPNVPLAGIPSQFVKQLKKIKRNQEILSIVKEYQIPFTNLPVQKKPQNTIKMLEQHSLLLDQEI